MARKITILAIVLVVAFLSLASAAVNPAPKVAPEDETASPLPAEKGDDNDIGDGEGGTAAPGMAVEAPEEKKGGGAAALGASAAAGVFSTLVCGVFFNFY